MDNLPVPHNGDVNRACTVLLVTWIGCGLSLLFVACRVYCRTRMTRNMWWDDYCICFTMVSNHSSTRAITAGNSTLPLMIVADACCKLLRLVYTLHCQRRSSPSLLHELFPARESHRAQLDISGHCYFGHCDWEGVGRHTHWAAHGSKQVAKMVPLFSVGYRARLSHCLHRNHILAMHSLESTLGPFDRPVLGSKRLQ